LSGLLPTLNLMGEAALAFALTAGLAGMLLRRTAGARPKEA
jgi:hypothetical protein